MLSLILQIAIIFKNCIYDEDKRQLEEIVAEIMDYLDEYEQELNIRQTSFYGGSCNDLDFIFIYFHLPFIPYKIFDLGNNPGILDILMWPWVERAKALPLLYKQPAGFDKERFPKLVSIRHGVSNVSFLKFLNSAIFLNISLHALYDNYLLITICFAADEMDKRDEGATVC